VSWVFISKMALSIDLLVLANALFCVYQKTVPAEGAGLNFPIRAVRCQFSRAKTTSSSLT
jgi:hypothetical protein